MKIICPKEELHHAVQTVQKAVATKTPLPILTGIYLSAENGQLQLQATDYEVGICCTIAATVEEAGAVVLSGRYFQELVRRLPGETVEIASSHEDRTIKVTSQNSQFNLLSLPAEEFPVLKPLSSDNVLNVQDAVLRELIRKTIFACATDEARPIFTGGLMEVDGQEIRMVATNTHRLALKKETLAADAGSAKMIIPAKILGEVARLLAGDEPKEVSISWQKNQVGIVFDNVYINSRLIEGQFPDYNKVIPANYATTVKLNTDQFLDAVERVSLLARDGEYNVVRFNFNNGEVVITSNNPDIGKAREIVAAAIDGNDIEIAFNAKYITDILKNIDGEELVVSLNAPLSPAGIKAVGDDKYIYIITPVRTS